MTDAPFIATICERPDDMFAREVYAQWLYEGGEVDRADFITTQIDLAAKSAELPPLIIGSQTQFDGEMPAFDNLNTKKERWSKAYTATVRHQFQQLEIGNRIEVRQDVGNGRQFKNTVWLRGMVERQELLSARVNRPGEIDTTITIEQFNLDAMFPDRAEVIALQSRAAALLDAHAKDWLVPLAAACGLDVTRRADGSYPHHDNTVVTNLSADDGREERIELHPTFRRGFVELVRCPAETWLAVGDAALGVEPIREVTFTDWPVNHVPYRSGLGDEYLARCQRWFKGRWPSIRELRLPEPQPATPSIQEVQANGVRISGTMVDQNFALTSIYIMPTEDRRIRVIRIHQVGDADPMTFAHYAPLNAIMGGEVIANPGSIILTTGQSVSVGPAEGEPLLTARWDGERLFASGGNSERGFATGFARDAITLSSPPYNLLPVAAGELTPQQRASLLEYEQEDVTE